MFGVFCSPAGDVLGNGVEVFNVALAVSGDDRVTNRVQRNLGEFFLLIERILKRLTGGDIGLRSSDAIWVAVFIPKRGASGKKPTIGAIAMAQSVFALELWTFAGEVLFKQGLESCAVVRMKAGEPLPGLDRKSVV